MQRRELKHNIIIGLLVFLFLAPFVSQSIHVYENECIEHACPHSDDKATHKHDCNTCKVCQFHFSLFTEADPLLLNIKPTELSRLIYSSYQEKGYYSIFNLSQLRAPPHSFVL